MYVMLPFVSVLMSLLWDMSDVIWWFEWLLQVRWTVWPRCMLVMQTVWRVLKCSFIYEQCLLAIWKKPCNEPAVNYHHLNQSVEQRHNSIWMLMLLCAFINRHLISNTFKELYSCDMSWPTLVSPCSLCSSHIWRQMSLIR